jgi:hypothetical protein
LGTPTPKPTAPGKPASRQPPDANTGQDRDGDEGQELPKTGRDRSEPIEEDVADDILTDDADDDDDDMDDDDADEDESGTLELPGEGGERDRLNSSSPKDDQ